MSYLAPPPGIGGGIGRPMSRQGSRENLNEVNSHLQALALDSPSQGHKKKSKRTMRAYHSDFNSPIGSTVGSPIPSHANTFTGVPSPGIPYGFPSDPLASPRPQQQLQSPYPGVSQQFTPPIQQFQHQPQQQIQQQQQSIGGPQVDQFHLQDMTTTQNQGRSNDLSLQLHRYQDQKKYITPDEEGNLKPFLTFSETIPPEAGTQFQAIDQGTASSKFMRSTMYYVPESEPVRAATKLPLAITIRPFAPLLSTEDPIPVVDFSQRDQQSQISISESDNDGSEKEKDPLSIGPLRCRRCRCYVNPSMQFTHTQRFVCNICQFPNNIVPEEYASYLDNNGYRLDKFIRPELHKSVYDILVPKEYNFGGAGVEPKPIHFVFLIDISESSIKQKIPLLVADAIRATLFDFEQEYQDQLPDEKPKLKIAIAAFDKRIHFFNLSPNLERAEISISGDLEDPFIPFHDGLFVDPEESRFVIDDALNYIERFSSDPERIFDPEPCFAAACRTIMMCLDSVGGGGKIISILSNLPTWGPGGLKFKDNKAVGRVAVTAEAEKRLYTPDNEYYKTLAKDFISKNVGIDVFVVSHVPVDLSNVGWLASVTGGEVTRWANFNFERDARSVTAKIVGSVKKLTGYQGQLKLRCSNGLQVAQYYGTSSSIAEANSMVAGTVQDPIIPVLNQDQTFTVLLEYDGKLSTKLDCHFQAALLYTDPNGIRKVRVINLVLAVTKKLEDVFHFADENAIVTTIVRDTLSFIGQQTLLELREALNNKLVDVFARYRAMNEYDHNSAAIMTNKLLFPDSLKHLPTYILSFLKTTAIRAQQSVNSDTRLVDVFAMLNMPVERLMYHLYPALVELHSLESEEGHWVSEDREFISLPVYKDLSNRSLDRGVYILCDGLKVFVWIDPEANIMLLRDLFGDSVGSIQDINPLMDELPVLETEISQQARNIIRYFQSHLVGLMGLGSAGIQIVRKGLDGNEFAFREMLMDDSFGGAVTATSGPSYPEYLTNLHRAIKVTMESDKGSKQIKNSISNVEHEHATIAQRYMHF
ncbi:SFB3 [[Candida] subhashii]|uniref:SFB3 n=1 Tax=[Candida] subhashii TaxID=561895 RepID=A0A8J5QKB9_9ASCO|nr:SFB3 [[Candida] subhashii]KAG7664662.1 SFB3 [[Candida] subhashii]